MKLRRLSLLITFVFASSLYGFSQEPLEGVGDTSLIKSSQSVEKPRRLRNEPPKFFFGFSYIKPIGAFARDDHYYDPYTYYQEDEIPYSLIKGGVSFEFGNMFWFNRIKILPEKMKLGVMVVYFNPQFFMDEGAEFPAYIIPGIGVTDFVLTFKVGPTFAYNIARNLFLETDFTFEPSFYFRNLGSPVFMMRYSPRINLRYRAVYIGVDFSFGKFQKKEYIESQDELGYQIQDKFEHHTSTLNQFRVTLGFNF